jgi:hypothetical protein
MNTFLLNCGKQHEQYRIVAEYSNNVALLALAGFCAEEQTENLLFKHLQNLCVQSDGSLSNTHFLLNNLLQQWQNSFSIPALQMLNHINGNEVHEKIKSVCLYKTKTGEPEKLINRILL